MRLTLSGCMSEPNIVKRQKSSEHVTLFLTAHSVVRATLHRSRRDRLCEGVRPAFQRRFRDAYGCVSAKRVKISRYFAYCQLVKCDIALA
jgi:hypothetical protein